MKTAPDWRELVMGRVDATLDSYRAPGKRPYRDLRIRILVAGYSSVVTAAHARGMSITAYGRRAIMAFVAHDLGVPLEDVLEDEPDMAIYDANNKRTTVTIDERHGKWKIEGLK